MSSKTLTYLVRTAVIAVAICGIFICGFILPNFGSNFAEQNPEFAYMFVPWLVFLLIAAAPCFVILGFVWRVTVQIRKEQVFTELTARLVKIASIIMLCDIIFFFIGNVTLGFLEMTHPAVMLCALFICIFGLALSVAAATLARYISKAAALQEEVEGTI